MDRTLRFALVSLIFNMIFGVYYLVLGIVVGSWWLFTLGIYYSILSTVRFVVLRTVKEKTFVVKFTGWMLMALSIPLVATVILSVIKDRGTQHHMIVMIAIATYASTKITLATINFIKSRHSDSCKMIALRNISFANGFASIFALQRSMLVTFEGMSSWKIQIMNAALGSAVSIIVFGLGLNLVRSKKIPISTLTDEAK